MSKSLLSLFTKVWPKVICSHRSVKKSDISDSWVIRANPFQKRAIQSKKLIFICFWQFFTAFPLVMPKRESLPSLFAQFLFRATGMIGSCHSVQMTYREQIAPIALRSTVSDLLLSLFTNDQTWAIRSFSRANPSFAHKKRAIRSKNRQVNSQPASKQPWFLAYSIFFGIRHLPLPWDIQYVANG